MTRVVGVKVAMEVANVSLYLATMSESSVLKVELVKGSINWNSLLTLTVSIT